MASGPPTAPIIPKPGSIFSFPGFTRTALPSGIAYTRCMEHMEITDESLGLAKPKAKPAKDPMRPEHDNVRMKPSLGLKVEHESARIGGKRPI